jgi:SAM-dependent methyltransferase
MKFSIFTPSHDTRYLVDAFCSLIAQSYADWEWVVVLNHGATLPAEIDDTRVRALVAPAWVAPLGVGALKKYACDQCHGEYLVELDHDDLLLPHALAEIARAVDVYDADFIYSDAANFRADGSFELYGADWGWEHYEQKAGEQTLKVNRSFPANASSLHQIFFAPNHVRVWRAATYHEVGGHDMTLGVCDDYDLLCRTFLAGATFHHIPECLYLYRLQEDGSNTWLKKNAEIQQKQLALSNRYTHLLVYEWCRREGLPKLDVGGKPSCPEGFISFDPQSGIDLRQRWPLADDSVGCVRAYDFLERIPHCADASCKHTAPLCVVGVMNEIYRILAPGGWLLSATPSTDGRGAFQDPTHCSFWNPNSFWYYTRAQQKQQLSGVNVRFQSTRLWQEFPSDWHKQNDILYVYADLVALKGQRQPGQVLV